MASLGHQELTHWSPDKTAPILQKTFSSAFSWEKIYVFWLNFHFPLLVGDATINQVVLAKSLTIQNGSDAMFNDEMNAITIYIYIYVAGPCINGYSMILVRERFWIICAVRSGFTFLGFDSAFSIVWIVWICILSRICHDGKQIVHQEVLGVANLDLSVCKYWHLNIFLSVWHKGFGSKNKIL